MVPEGTTRTLAELALASGVAARTIRYYIARGLVPPPLAGGRSTCYGDAHLERLERIRELQSQGLTLAEVAWKLAQHHEEHAAPQASAWLHYPLADDVTVLVRSDASPWRMKRLRSLLSQLAAQLKSAENTEDTDA